MEIKKEPKVNLEARKTTYVMTGLVGILALLFVALEWSTTSRRNRNLVARTMMEDTETEMIITVQQPTPPPPPPPLPDVIEQINVVDEDVLIEEVDVQSYEDNEDILVQVIDLTGNNGPSDEEEVDDSTPFVIVEQQPEFPGGQSALMAYLSKSIKYPPFAAENGIQGRTTLSFTVEKDGSISNIEVMRSPAEELSKEAVRVVQAMPKWKPGKQRGKAVRVKYVLPVTFRLS